MVRVSCIQLNSSDNVQENIAAASLLIRRAKETGAELVATPEMTSLLDRRSGALFAKAKPQEQDEALAAFLSLAHELDIWLLVGSLPILIEKEKCAKRSFLISPKGEITASYDKIHMFDADPTEEQSYRESDKYMPGRAAVVADLLGTRLGLSICYDMRFPQLYRMLAQSGAEILAVPSAFTQITGEAHWHTLLRARAIETGSFVIAPAQAGVHADGRETYGHSIIIGPWGDILAEAGTEPCVISADIDLAQVKEARLRIPSLARDMPIDAPVS